MTSAHITPIHKIFFLDAKLKSVLDESDVRGFCKKYFSDLLDAIKMFPLAPMSASPAADLGAPGFSGVQELTTSHTSFHYFWEPNHPTKNPNVHIDLYSCAPFEYRDLIRVANRHFDMEEWMGTLVERTIDSAKRSVMQVSGRGGDVLESVVMSPASEQSAITAHAYHATSA